MALVSGTLLGPYEIQSPLGAGGMGEVYRARDTRLDRVVAVKILPEHLCSNPDAKQRFDREARAISSLSHPNICHLYDVGQHNGISYLVMEYLEGETLGERLRKGRLPLEQVFRVGVEICQGLEQAHRSGVVHRDLKPGNIMLTKSGAKLMDFGLAKAPAAPLGNLSGSNSLATMSQPLTTEGTIVGTIQYMAPEQLEGKEADKRSDIFALGSVLYEMVTGKRAFEGKTTASTIASILAVEPKPLSAMQPLSPPALERVIATCIAKDPEERWQSCADVSRQLEWLAKASNPAEVSPRSGRGIWTVVVAAVVLIAAAFVVGTRWSKTPVGVSQFEVNPPPSTYFNFRGLSGPPVPSPDGSKVAFVAFTSGKSGTAGLWLRALDSTEARFLPGTEGAVYPFWSPDGKFLAFFAGGKLKKLDLSGGSAIPLCEVLEGRGGAWSTDGVILFGLRAGPLFRVDASGGKPVQLTSLDEARHETSHRFPQFLPDQKHFLFVAQAPQIPTAHTFVASLDARKPVIIEDVISSAIFSNNHLFYVLDNSLLIRGFDSATIRFTGEPVVIAEHVQNDPQFNFSAFSVSASTLIYQTGAVVAGTRLVSYDRSGKPTVLSAEKDLVQTITLSPKEDQLAASLGISSGQLNDIWVFELRTNTKAKLTFDQHSFSPAWSPDGKKLAFDRVDADGDTIIAKDVSGSGGEEVLLRLPIQRGNAGDRVPQKLYTVGWTPDGKYLIFRGPDEVSALALDRGRKLTPLFPAKLGTFGVAMSPDGRWLAYSSNETGLPEIYVVPFRTLPDGTPSIAGGKWQVSNGGGTFPIWRGDGKELFFTNSSSATLMSASLNTNGEHFQSDKPQPLFDLDAHPVGNYYAVPRNGQKIYMTTYGAGSTAPFTVTTNWLDLVKR